MPFGRVTIVEGRSAEQKHAAAVAITEAIATHCGGDPAHVYVAFDEVPATDWTVGGVTVAERRRQRGEG